MDLSQILEGKSVIVTGGARGLGAAMATSLLNAGAQVVIADIDIDVGPRFASYYDRVKLIRADVTNSDEVEMVADACANTYGRIDALINNAGVLMREVRRRIDKPEGRILFWEVDTETIKFFIDVHVIGSFQMAKAVLPFMMKQAAGRIITITTSFRTMLGPGRTPYGPAKAAMEALAAVMAKDLESTGVAVNVLIPGGPARESLSIPQGFGRIEPGIMGPPVVWLVSDQSAGVTGKRFVASLWDTNLDPTEAQKLAGSNIAWGA